MLVKPFTVDKTKVKRIFVYGCSYTSYQWPTWANMIQKEFPQAEFYNFGRIGSGNQAISCRIAETDARFKFNENDLVMVMWSSYIRNDYWLYHEKSWFGAGNVYGTQFYDDQYRQIYANSISGFLIKNFALMRMTQTNLAHLPCQSIIMHSVPNTYYDNVVFQPHEETMIKEIHNVYQSDFLNIPKTLLDLDVRIPITHSYEYPGMPSDKSNLFHDQHPSPSDYFNYINNNIMTLSPSTEEYAKRSTTELVQLKTFKEIENHFQTNNTVENVLF